MIVIPMAGLSSRFSKAGYTQPKYMLPLNGKTVFAHSVESFKAYFQDTPFLFIARSIMNTENFIQTEIDKLGIKKANIVILDHPTAGQAETVEYGIHKAGLENNMALTIFNIDTFRKDFHFPQQEWFKHSDGYLEVFKGNGENWSYVEPDSESQEPIALRTAEKKPISDLCCNGLYHFKKSGDFLYALQQERKTPSTSELYIAPLYNYLIQNNKKIHYKLVNKDCITFCGIPAEYEALCKNS